MSHPSHQKSSTYNIGHDPTHWRKVVLMSKERNDRYATAEEMAPQPVSIVYSREPTDFITAMYSGMYGLGVGWSVLISENDVPRRITGAELNNMVIDANCVLD